MHSVAQGIAWAKSPAARYRDGKSWSGWCQSFVFRFSGATRSASTAYLAFKGSGPVQSKDPSKAPKGAFHWWSDSGAGHVAISLGNGEAAMASASVTTSWGDAQGSVSVTHYNSIKPALRYLGWTFDMLGQRMTDVDDYIKAETAKEAAAAAAAKAAKAAAAKAAADRAAADKAAAADQAAATQALAEAAAAATPIPEVKMFLPIVHEAGQAAYFLLLEGGNKVHLTGPQWQVYKVLGASVTEVPAGALAAFKTITT